MENDNMETVELEIDADLLEQLRAILSPAGITPEEAAGQFIRYCTDQNNREQAAALLKKWQAEQAVN